MEQSPGRNSSAEWMDPVTGQPIRGVKLTAAVSHGIPGVRIGEAQLLHPIVRGLAPDGRELVAYYMYLGGPVVGILEASTTVPDSSLDL